MPPTTNTTETVHLSYGGSVEVRRLAKSTIVRLTALAGEGNAIEAGMLIAKAAIRGGENLESEDGVSVPFSWESHKVGQIASDWVIDAVIRDDDAMDRILLIAAPDIAEDESGKSESSPDGSTGSDETPATEPLDAPLEPRPLSTSPAPAATNGRD